MMWTSSIQEEEILTTQVQSPEDLARNRMKGARVLSWKLLQGQKHFRLNGVNPLHFSHLVHQLHRRFIDYSYPKSIQDSKGIYSD